MRNILSILFVLFIFTVTSVQAEENIRKVATWNMKWLGTNSGNQLDAVENVEEYVKYILRTKATFFALQEIGATHSIGGEPKCYYLDLILEKINEGITNDTEMWAYILDSINKSQRLAFLYKKDEWVVSNARSIKPGKSYQYIRKPFLVTVKAEGSNAELEFNFINIHLKAFDDATEKREKNIEQLSEWLETNSLDDDVLIAGDTNIYIGESELLKHIRDIGYVVLHDNEKTSIHKNVLSQRFDRFFSSPGLNNEINSAKSIVGNTEYIDVIKDNDSDKVIWFDQNISDHYPVVLNIDVSEER